MSRDKGFTLVEMIIVIGVIGVLGFIMTDLLVQTLRGQNKVRVLNQVKQNGQVVLDRLSNEIRQAEKLVCVGSIENLGVNDTIVILKNGSYTRFEFEPPDTTTGENGKIIRNDFTGDDIVSAGAEFDPTLCSLLSDFGTSQINNLTDVDTITGVSIDRDGTSPIFDEGPQAGYSSTVTIKFRARQGAKAGTTFESTVSEQGVLFQTSIVVRGEKR